MKRQTPPASGSGPSGSLNRRDFAKLAAAVPLTTPLLMQLRDCRETPYAGGLTDVEGIKVGHYNSEKRATGCTVVLAEAGAVAGVDVRGSAPGTRETDLLNPINTVQKVHAVFLSGGSAFGLDAVAGVVRHLEEKGIGFDTGEAKVPIVPAAVLYDLALGNPRIRPDHHNAYLACAKASPGPVPEGNVGVGAGATVGKLMGRKRAMKGGLGSFSIRVGDLVVAALAAVNCVGDVLDPKTGKIIAGARSDDGKTFLDLAASLRTQAPAQLFKPGENTTLGVISTNAKFDKAGMTKIAQMAQDGLARAINPAHTPADGDTIFALSNGRIETADLGHVGALAAEAFSEAVVRAALKAGSLPYYPAACDLGN